MINAIKIVVGESDPTAMNNAVDYMRDNTVNLVVWAGDGRELLFDNTDIIEEFNRRGIAQYILIERHDSIDCFRRFGLKIIISEEVDVADMNVTGATLLRSIPLHAPLATIIDHVRMIEKHPCKCVLMIPWIGPDIYEYVPKLHELRRKHRPDDANWVIPIEYTATMVFEGKNITDSLGINRHDFTNKFTDKLLLKGFLRYTQMNS